MATTRFTSIREVSTAASGLTSPCHPAKTEEIQNMHREEYTAKERTAGEVPHQVQQTDKARYRGQSKLKTTEKEIQEWMLDEQRKQEGQQERSKRHGPVGIEKPNKRLEAKEPEKNQMEQLTEAKTGDLPRKTRETRQQRGEISPGNKIRRKKKEMQELGWRAWGSKRKSSQLKARIVKAARGRAAMPRLTKRSKVVWKWMGGALQDQDGRGGYKKGRRL